MDIINYGLMKFKRIQVFSLLFFGQFSMYQKLFLCIICLKKRNINVFSK